MTDNLPSDEQGGDPDSAEFSHFPGAAPNMRLWQNNFELLGMMTMRGMHREVAETHYCDHYRDLTGEFSPTNISRALAVLHSECLAWVSTPIELLDEQPLVQLPEMLKTLDKFAPIMQATAHRLNVPLVEAHSGTASLEQQHAARFFTTIYCQLEDMRKDIRDIAKVGLVQTGKSAEEFKAQKLLGRFAATMQEKAILAVHAVLAFKEYREGLYALVEEKGDADLMKALKAMEKATIRYAKEEATTEKTLEVYSEHARKVYDMAEKLGANEPDFTATPGGIAFSLLQASLLESVGRGKAQ